MVTDLAVQRVLFFIIVKKASLSQHSCQNHIVILSAVSRWCVGCFLGTSSTIVYYFRGLTVMPTAGFYSVWAFYNAPLSMVVYSSKCFLHSMTPSQVVYTRVTRGMLHEDKLVFALLLCRIHLRGFSQWVLDLHSPHSCWHAGRVAAFSGSRFLLALVGYTSWHLQWCDSCANCAKVCQ